MTNFILIQQLELTGFNPRMYENVSRTTHARHYSEFPGMRRVYGFFWLPIARLHGIFPREDRGFKEFRGFPDMELGIFRVAKILRWGPSFGSRLWVSGRLVRRGSPYKKFRLPRNASQKNSNFTDARNLNLGPVSGTALASSGPCPSTGSIGSRSA